MCLCSLCSASVVSSELEAAAAAAGRFSLGPLKQLLDEAALHNGLQNGFDLRAHLYSLRL